MTGLDQNCFCIFGFGFGRQTLIRLPVVAFVIANAFNDLLKSSMYFMCTCEIHR